LPNGDVLDTFINRLTDAYNKNPESNVYKLAKIAADNIQDNEDLLFTIRDFRDIDQAAGVPLDEIGRDIGQSRGVTGDDVFRTLIKAKIRRNLSDGSIETLIDFISFILSCDPSEIYIRERWTEYFNQTILANFVGKVTGSTVGNPNLFRQYTGVLPGTVTPANILSGIDRLQNEYDWVKALDGGTLSSRTSTTIGQSSGMMFSFDMISIVERKYGFTIPGANTAAKVAWLKSNISSLAANWFGFGSGPAGNKAYLAEWLADTSSWNVWGSHTSANVTKISATETTNESRLIDANGFVHYLVYADAAALATNPTIAPTLTASGSGSALTAGTYYVRYSRTNANGETLPSPETAITITAGQNINVTVPAMPFGITSSRVYIAKQEVQNFVGKLSGNVETLTNNFVGKVSGSTVENPNTWKSTGAAALAAPSGFSTELSTTEIAKGATLDGTVRNGSTVTSGNIIQQLFSFDLISIVERKYGVPIPGADTAAKVAWLKANVKTLAANWYGYGSAPGGNGATFAVWTGSAWGGASSHTSGTVQKIPYTTTTAISAIIDANGFAHFLAYGTTASDGTTASAINTDYIELLVDVVQLVASNPNSYKSAHSTSLIAPSGGYSEYSQAGIDKIKTLDGTVNSNSIAVSGEIRHDLFSFDLIAITEKRRGSAIPGADVTAKVTWLRTNITKVIAGWWGYGSGPAGNRATLYRWDRVGGSWQNNTAHTSGTVTKISSSTSSDYGQYIDANGFFHVLVAADASDGTTASVINSDYIELAVDYVDNNTRLQASTGSTSYTQAVALATGQFAAAANNATIASIIYTDYVELNVTLPDMKMGNAAIYVEAPIGPISQTGLSVKQFGTLLNMVTAAGVRADVLFEGTFELGEVPASGDNGVIDPSAGLAPADQSTGGTLGSAYNPDTDFELPL
jgi:hypothetical protein